MVPQVALSWNKALNSWAGTAITSRLYLHSLPCPQYTDGTCSMQSNFPFLQASRAAVCTVMF